MSAQPEAILEENLFKYYVTLNKLETTDNSVGPTFNNGGYFKNYLSAKKLSCKINIKNIN